MIYCEWVCVIMCKTQVGHKSLEMPYFSRVQTIKEIICFTIQNVLWRFRKVYYTPGLLFWGVFCENCGRMHLYGLIVYLNSNHIIYIVCLCERSIFMTTVTTKSVKVINNLNIYNASPQFKMLLLRCEISLLL